jgi:pSer/pThr/pTyr-binding forkhead associated (FHA) protein
MCKLSVVACAAVRLLYPGVRSGGQRDVDLCKPRVSIGRAASCDVVVPSPSQVVSSLHCIIHRVESGSGVELEDKRCEAAVRTLHDSSVSTRGRDTAHLCCGSLNGTFVNDRKVGNGNRVPLLSGSVVELSRLDTEGGPVTTL